jgi:ATP-dependent Clp protease protease subunit
MNAMFAIYDTIQFIRAPVATYCSGLAASAAAVILAGGTAGRRHALPNARVLIHQPHGGAQGQSVDIEIQAREMAFLRRRMHEILAFHTGQPIERIEKDTDRDYILGADDAVAYGLVDHVVSSRKLPLAAAAEPMLPPPAVPLAAPGYAPAAERGPVRLG